MIFNQKLYIFNKKCYNYIVKLKKEDSMLENLIDKHLEKQGFMRVPKSWSEDYKNIANKKLATDKVLRELGREYNALLKDFAESKTQKWLKEDLEEIGIDVSGLNKEELIQKYIDAYEVSFGEDFDEEVK